MLSFKFIFAAIVSVIVVVCVFQRNSVTFIRELQSDTTLEPTSYPTTLEQFSQFGHTVFGVGQPTYSPTNLPIATPTFPPTRQPRYPPTHGPSSESTFYPTVHLLRCILHIFWV